MSAAQPPLPDLLDRVPDDIVLGIPGDEPMFPSYTNIPIGKMAQEAAAELRRLHEENESLRQIVQDFPPVEAELREVSDRAHRLEAQRDALLEAERRVHKRVRILERLHQRYTMLRAARERVELLKEITA